MGIKIAIARAALVSTLCVAVAVTAQAAKFALASKTEGTGLVPAGTTTAPIKGTIPGGVLSTSVAFRATPLLNSFTPTRGPVGAVVTPSSVLTASSPIPTVISLSPPRGVAGNPAFTLKVIGTNFISSSEVLWHGSQVPTTYVSGTSLTAQIPASDLSSVGSARVAVRNPAPGGGTSGSLPFTITSATAKLILLDVEGTDVSWNPSQEKLYVAVPSSASAHGSTITAIDPIAGTVASEQQLSSAPSGLAISGNSEYLYAVVSGGTTIQRLILPSLKPDIHWSLGTDAQSGNANLAGDIRVQPGAPHTLAVSLGPYGSGSIAVFDDAVERPVTAGGGATLVGNSLQWKADGSELFAAYTLCNDSPYYTTVSDDALYTMPVNDKGPGSVTTYHSTFRQEGGHLHSDPTTGFVYGDWGEVVNAATGIPAGNYRWSRPLGSYFPGPLSVVDPSLRLFYTLLEVYEPNGTLAFQIQEFKQSQFQLLRTIVIPDAVGTPTNFIRWGQAGLAFVTNGGSGNANGKLYILDGSFVNPSAVPDTTAGTTLNAVPTLTAISPLTATMGSGTVTLRIKGRDFIGRPVVYWNGKSLPTTLVNSTEITAQIPASDLASVAQATITASNNATASLASNSMLFSVNSPPPSGNQISVYSTGGNDLVWDANTGKIYVSMPGVQGDSGDAIAIVDPVAGKVTSSGFLGSDPARISISDNGQYVYLALNGSNAIEQLTVPNFKVNAAWNLGGVGSFFGPNYALDVQAAPGAPQTTAVVLAAFGVSPASIAVVIYDGSTARPDQLQATLYPYSSLQWAGSASALYAADQQEPQDLLVLGVGASGVVIDQHYDGLLNPYSPSIHYDAGTGLVYTDAGQAIQPSHGTVIGTYGASGIAVPDSTLDRVFILGQTAAQVGTSNYTIESFDQTKFTPIGSITIANVVGTPTALIRWGSNGLAFTTQTGMPIDFTGTGPGQLYVISGNFVASSGAASEASRAVPQLPVQRNWNLRNPKHHSRSFVVNSNPLTE
jgi:hypothetical protein